MGMISASGVSKGDAEVVVQGGGVGVRVDSALGSRVVGVINRKGWLMEKVEISVRNGEE